MKKILVLTAIGAIITTPAIAVQKCVALGSKTTCTSLGRVTNGTADWNLTCTSSGTSFTVSGIGACSSTAGTVSTPASTLRYTSISTATDPNQCYVGDALYCWCRMLSPAISQWVFSGLSYQTESDCLYNCAVSCQLYITNESALRTAMFSTSTLSD